MTLATWMKTVLFLIQVFLVFISGTATGGVNQYYRPVDPLVLHGPAHLISERWRKWKRSFLFFISAQNITDPDRKHSFLLHFAGEAVQDLFETLSEPVPAVNDRIERTIAMLDKHFNVAKNTPFERHCFRQMAPTAGETVDKFVARLRLQAQHCSFAGLEDQLRDQLVEQINPPAIRRKELQQSSIKLKDTLKLARVGGGGGSVAGDGGDRPCHCEAGRYDNDDDDRCERGAGTRSKARAHRTGGSVLQLRREGPLRQGRRMSGSRQEVQQMWTEGTP